jgi:hypothetical protein
MFFLTHPVPARVKIGLDQTALILSELNPNPSLLPTACLSQTAGADGARRHRYGSTNLLTRHQVHISNFVGLSGGAAELKTRGQRPSQRPPFSGQLNRSARAQHFLRLLLVSPDHKRLARLNYCRSPHRDSGLACTVIADTCVMDRVGVASLETSCVTRELANTAVLVQHFAPGVWLTALVPPLGAGSHGRCRLQAQTLRRDPDSNVLSRQCRRGRADSLTSGH